jgi:hypothetical protein
VNTALGCEVPFALTVVEETVLPPVQLVGAVDCSTTLVVSVPVGEAAPLSDAEIDELAMGVPTLAVPGAVTVTVGETKGTTSSSDVEPQVVAADALSASPA